jgi:hypothetical protein
MKESRIELTERLRREGRWARARRYRRADFALYNRGRLSPGVPRKLENLEAACAMFLAYNTLLAAPETAERTEPATGCDDGRCGSPAVEF